LNFKLSKVIQCSDCGYKRLFRRGVKPTTLPPSSTEVMDVWSYTSTPVYVIMAWCLVKERDTSVMRFCWRKPHPETC